MSRAAAVTDVSLKQESFINIGKHRFRIASDHHAVLAELHESFTYVSMGDLLFLTSLIGANLLLSVNPINVLNVRNRARR